MLYWDSPAWMLCAERGHIVVWTAGDSTGDMSLGPMVCTRCGAVVNEDRRGSVAIGLNIFARVLYEP